MIAALFVVALVLAFLPYPAHANPPCGSTLTGANVLTSNVVCSAGGYVMASGASLNCQGFNLKGSNIPPPSCDPIVTGCVTGHYGIRIDGKTDVAVSNCVVRNFERGLYMTDSSTSLIANNVFKQNTRYGAQLSGASQGNLFTNNRYAGNSDEGIHISDLTLGANTLDGDQASNNVAEGFYLLFAHNLILQNCFTFTNGAPGIYHKNSTGTSVTNCVLNSDNMQILNDTGAGITLTNVEVGP